MTAFDRIQETLKRKKITPYRMCVDMGIPHTTFSGWKGGKRLPAEKVSEIAKYLGTTSAYLMCETDNPTPPDVKKDTPVGVSEEDIMFALFDGEVEDITDEMYAEVKDFARYVKDKQKRKADGDK